LLFILFEIIYKIIFFYFIIFQLFYLSNLVFYYFECYLFNKIIFFQFHFSFSHSFNKFEKKLKNYFLSYFSWHSQTLKNVFQLIFHDITDHQKIILKSTSKQTNKN